VTARAAPQAVPASGGGAGVPRHVAIIMDGNGRWAKKRFLPRIAGHRAGVDAVRRTVEAAGEVGLDVVTLYAFSSENWKRPADEVGDLMGLLRHYLQSEIDELDAKGVRLRSIGDISRLHPDVRTLLEGGIARTAGNQGLTLVLALNYGAQDEIVRAARAAGPDLTAESLEKHLDTADLPPPDVIVRTSGEQRLSNFMLWQAAYAELVFTDVLWPDFGRRDLDAVIAEFGRRERRYGGL
jgi:undecaprenyl diphosphate synthase